MWEIGLLAQLPLQSSFRRTPKVGFSWGVISGVVITICSIDEVVGAGDVGTQM